MRRWIFVAVMVGIGSLSPRSAQAQVHGPLEVFNAGSLAVPFHHLLQAFAVRYPGVEPAQENSGSLAAARKLTELEKIPDVLAVADVDPERRPRVGQRTLEAGAVSA